MDTQAESDHASRFRITLEVVPDDPHDADPALVDAVGREAADALRTDGYTIEPVYTGTRGGGLLVDVVMPVLATAWAQKDVILADGSALIITHCPLVLYSGQGLKMVTDIDGYDLSLALHWILESRNLLRRQIDACQHGKVVRQVATTKDLREMCQNGVTLDDLRRLYGVNATLEDLELVMPSPLIGDLGILPCSEVETKGLSESEEESEDVEEEKVSPNSDVGGEEVRDCQDVGKEEVQASHDAGEEEISPSEVGKSKEALPHLSSMGQQAAREMEPQVPSFYDPLLTLCLLSQSSNVLDVLMSLEILSRLT